MKRILLILAAVAALAPGCGDNQNPPPQHRVGAVNSVTAPPCETLTLAVSTIHSAARITLGVDTLSANIVNLTGTASGAYTFEGSNDNSNWFTITLPNTPPALASGVPTMLPISYEGGWPWGYWRVTYVGTGGSGTSSVCEVMKG